MTGARLLVNSVLYPLKSLSYTAECDVHCTSLPANQFVCEVVLDDTHTISVGEKAYISGPDGQVYGGYRISVLEKLEEYVYKVTAKSPLAILDESELPIYVISDGSSRYLNDYLVEILTPIAGDYTIASTVGGMIAGGCYPKQTRRERLLWVLFVMGCYVAFQFDGTLLITVLDASASLIQMKKIFWRPTLGKTELVTRIECNTYKYTDTIPENFYDDYIAYDEFSDGEQEGEFITERIVQEQTKSVVYYDNPDAPSGSTPNVINVDMTCVYPGRAGAIMNRLGNRYFTQDEITCDVVNNHEYYPGQLVAVYVSKTEVYQGYVATCEFRFGAANVRSRLKLTQCTEVEMGGPITVQYVDYETSEVVYEEEEVYFPLGWHYVYTPKALEIYTSNTMRKIFRPITTTLEGTVASTATTLTVNNYCEIEHDDSTGITSVWGVDDVTESTETDSSDDTIYITELQGGGSTSVNESSWEVTS